MNIAFSCYDDESVRKKARLLRVITRTDKIEKFPIMEFIEHVLCGPESNVNFEVVEKEKMLDEYASTDTIRGVIKARIDVYERAAAGNPRDRFTLCHEVGHYFLHQIDSLEFARGMVPVQHQPEHQANVFAAELLAPLTMIDGLTVEEISKRFGISKQSASYQKQKIDMQRVGVYSLA